MSEPIVLGIESTCDETAAAVVQGRTLISNVVASSMDDHARYGGVIPEIASRAHAEAFVPCVSKALADADMTLSDIDAIAVSAGPGLAGCLAVGVSGAKALAWAANKPIYGINHVIGHIAVTQLQFGPFPKDTLALIVSGGHTSLLHVEDVARHIDVVGTTLDDAAGECFDKVARLLGFPIREARISTVTPSRATHMPSRCRRDSPKAKPEGNTHTTSVSPGSRPPSHVGLNSVRPQVLRFPSTTCALRWPTPLPPCLPKKPCEAVNSMIPAH